MKRAFILLTILFARTLHAAAIDAKALETLIDGVMSAEMKKQQIPGAAFILVQNGRVVLVKGYGLADVERKKPVDPAMTIFPIGSVTKVFTATAVVQLADRGKLDLNADVNRYLKTVKVPATYAAPMTARHLLTHSAGFDEPPYSSASTAARSSTSSKSRNSNRTFMANSSSRSRTARR